MRHPKEIRNRFAPRAARTSLIITTIAANKNPKQSKIKKAQDVGKNHIRYIRVVNKYRRD